MTYSEIINNDKTIIKTIPVIMFMYFIPDTIITNQIEGKIF